MISGVAVYALRLTVEGRDQLGAADAFIRDMQVARIVIKEDLLLAAPRITRDEFGNRNPGAFMGGKGLAFRVPKDGEAVLLAFVRRGWANTGAAAPRPTLQAVEYLLIDDRLVRRSRPYLDDAERQPRMDRTLLTGVGAAEVAFFLNETSAGINWVELWPSPQVSAPIPAAVKLTLTMKSFGVFEQLFYLGEPGR